MAKIFTLDGVITHAAKIEVRGCNTLEEAVAKAQNKAEFDIIERYDKFPEFEWDGSEETVEEEEE